MLRIDDISELRAQLTDEKIKRLEQSAIFQEKLAYQSQEHIREMRRAEQMRLDAVRDVDVAASKTEAERGLQAINTLAATNKTDAENLRNALNNTATMMAKQVSDVADALGKQTASSFAELSTRVAAVEKTQYEGMGKQAVVDPQTARLAAAVEGLMAAQAQGAGKSKGGAEMWGYMIGAVGLIATLLLIYARTGVH